MPIILKNLAQVHLPEKFRQKVLEEYIHFNRAGDHIRNYKYSKGVAYLPLNIRKLRWVASLLGEEIVDERSEGAELSAPFELTEAFKFRDHQAGPAQELLDFTLKNNYAVLKAPCSCGKTVVMTYVAGHLNKKILILVDMGSLQTQWAEAFELVWNRKAQIINKSTTEFSDVCITTFQLLNFNPELLKAVRNHFGTLVLDEFHTTASDTRREVLFQLSNKYRLACTATLMRKGFANEVLTDTVADASVEMIDPKALVADVHFVASPVSYFSQSPDDWGKITSKLGSSLERNKFVAGLVVTLARSGRVMAVIGPTIEGLEEILRMLINFPECKPRLYIGGTTLKEDKQLRDDLEQGKINILLTVKKLDKGFDAPRLDCLVLAKPANNQAFVVQISGRIVRPLEGKPTPVIYDIVDKGQLSTRFKQNRRGWYKALGYNVIEEA